MFTHVAYKWVLGSLLTVALLGLPACQTTPKEQPQALIGQVDKPQKTLRKAVGTAIMVFLAKVHTGVDHNKVTCLL